MDPCCKARRQTQGYPASMSCCTMAVATSSSFSVFSSQETLTLTYVYVCVSHARAADCRLTVQAECPMHLEDFPMDSHSCPLKFGSCESVLFTLYRQTESLHCPLATSSLEPTPGLLQQSTSLILITFRTKGNKNFNTLLCCSQ